MNMIRGSRRKVHTSGS